MFKQSTIALYVSALALILSGLSTYFTLFRQTEVLDVAVVTVPDLILLQKDLFFAGPIKVALVNRGARAAAVVNINITLVQVIKVTDDVCNNYTYSAEFTLKHAPVAVPVNEITMIDMSLDSKQPIEGNKSIFDWSAQPVVLYGCIRLDDVGLAEHTGMETTDAAFFASYRFDMKNQPQGYVAWHAEILEFRGSTKRLINHTLTIFD